MNNNIEIGDRFEGVLLETIKDDNASRPRVRPLEYFEQDIRVEFPRTLRENNPIGTRFRADVKISQKTKNNEPWGRPYLVASDNSIVKIEDFKPAKLIKAIRLNTVSDRAYEYIEKEFNQEPTSVRFEDFRKKAYLNSVEEPKRTISTPIEKIKRLEIIKTYALSRAGGKCECCDNEAPFLKRNGQPYLEVHHLTELAESGSDSPVNVAAICPNCHARITHGIDGKSLNSSLKIKILKLESELN